MRTIAVDKRNSRRDDKLLVDAAFNELLQRVHVLYHCEISIVLLLTTEMEVIITPRGKID
jgi:hypothetical protein